jgi:hypothetical protein
MPATSPDSTNKTGAANKFNTYLRAYGGGLVDDY